MPKKCKPKKPCCGFTLIELLVVIAIIAILSTLAVVSLGTARAKANDAKRQADLRTIQTALEMYMAENNKYPISATWGGLKTDLTPYITTFPEPPITDDAADIYCYYTNAEGKNYTLLANKIQKAKDIAGDHDGSIIPADATGRGTKAGCPADEAGDECAKGALLDVFCLAQ